MAPNTQSHLQTWLDNHDGRIDRFRSPLPVASVANETHVDEQVIIQALKSDSEPCFHAWGHRHGSKVSASKPYCLRLNGPETVGIDWEYSVIGAVEAEFRRRGYDTCAEIGTDSDLAHLARECSLVDLLPGVNQRDLWAIKRDGDVVDAWIIEAKGKEAAEFDHYCFAEVLGQVFTVSGTALSALLGSGCKDSHGLCWRMACRLLREWQQHGLIPTVTVAILVPNWQPDVVWKGGSVRRIPDAYYSRPLRAWDQFVATGLTLSQNGRYKYERAFGQMLEDLEREYAVRSAVSAAHGLRFRVLTTQADPVTSDFCVAGLG